MSCDFADSFVSGVCEGAKPNWVVTSPPYKNVVGFVRAALAVCRMGAALKLSLAILTPCSDRESWLVKNAPHICIFLKRQKYGDRYPRQKYGDRYSTTGEFWGGWYSEQMHGKMPNARILFS